jgi:hypothetical protein
LEDTFNDPVFKHLFDLDRSERICRSSLSERLSKIDSDYFRPIYECIYEQFSEIYSSADKEKYNIIRVDSSMVSEACGKLLEHGMDHKNGKKSIKYSIAFDGVLPCQAKVFTESSYANEDVALPEVVRGHVKEETGHTNIYVLDRGLQSARTMKDFSKESIPFVIRAKEKRKYIELESYIKQDTDTELGGLTLLKDSRIYLFTGIPMITEKGTKIWKQQLVEIPFRLVIGQSKQQPDKEFWFITNDFKRSAKEIADIYRQRWDIEVFFRFIKQELNVSHPVSLNKNGMEVMLYMTLIVAMLILIYKQANKLGYKTAKRRFAMEIRNLIIALIVVECGGDPSIFFKT